MKKEETINKTKNIDKKLVIILLAILLIIIIVTAKYFFKDSISNISKVTNTKYDSISCINKNCDGLIATVVKEKNTTAFIYNSNGKYIGSYTYKNDKSSFKPYDLSKNYLLMKKGEKDNIKYSITNKNGKKLYSTSNKLIKINDNYVIEQIKSKIDYKYKVFNSNGKLIYKNITNFDSYDDNNYIYIEKDNKSFIMNTNNKKIFNNYKIKEEIKDKENKTLYFILTKTNNDLYYFFNLKYNEISLNGFNSYLKKYDNTLIVNRKENNSNVKYSINLNGAENKISSSKFMTDLLKSYSKLIDSNKYYLYSSSITTDNQDNVIVDDIDNKSLGILNIKTNKFNELYKYSNDKFFSSIDSIKSSDGKDYIQLSCNNSECDKSKTYLYNITDNKIILSIDDAQEKLATNITYYTNGYKVIKYSSSSNNEKIKGKYVLYDKNDKELLVSSNEIVIIDSKVVIGETSTKSIVIYSKSQNKALNDDNSLATLKVINNKDFYTFNKDNKNHVINIKGKDVYSDESDLKFGNNSIYSVTNTKVTIYNIKNDRVNTYTFAENENILNESGNEISPFENILFVNNKKDKYFKVINDDGNTITKIKKSNIFDVKINNKTNKVYIIVLNSNNKIVKYGLYIGK